MPTRLIAVTMNVLALAALWCAVSYARAQEYEREPIEYGKREPANQVSRLAAEVQGGKRKLKFDEKFGYLPDLLRALEVPQSSQMLVFSKTSLQRNRITPRTPRAIYFNDDVYVGYCHEGDAIEVSVADPQLGAVFYTLDQTPEARPVLVRQQEQCLICHGSPNTRNIPGHVVRSVYSDAGGLPILASGTFRIDHTSPLKQRWGGWYVTGTHGEQTHLGNLIVRGQSRPEEVDNAAGHNVTELKDRFDTDNYLTPHSDLIALMVLEHQADCHNYITQANFTTQQALYFDRALKRDLKEESPELRDSTKSRIKSGCEPLVEYLLFSEEAPLTHALKGTTSFADEFEKQGPRDKQGRSLRDFDLSRRMFKYPCSYLIYSPSFAALPAEAKKYVYRRLNEVLSGEDPSEKFAHLTAADRRAVLEILKETHPDF
ncbi:hypothetical protein ETAA8_25290 [Anatilimnocola aggregata]|uniref:Cytochrome c domain-containing protein n=1 Tax=Anatilimnocola aggregata TaxID=2528021 RepID=A0A517YB64_9BACT|nr:hypothetical protein [Anatilimnocola aggregata]QDU27441.1 hypothetical protein ETAA8_25290 [Anatilimnocola aggregata]